MESKQSYFSRLWQNNTSVYSDQFFQGNPVSKRRARITSEEQLPPTALYLYKNRGNLLALDFFWIQQVESRNLFTYFERLAELYELFITPQLTKNNLWDTSFLKKCEFFISTPENSEALLKNILELLSLNNPTIHAELSRFVIDLSQNGDSQLFKSLHKKFTQFLRNPTLTSFVLPVVTEYETLEAHVALMGIGKCFTDPSILYFLYLDPHGFSDELQTENALGQKQIKNTFKQYFKTTHNITLVEILPTCPALQVYEQGGNCASWYLLHFVLFMSHPNFLNNVQEIIHILTKQQTLNVHLFVLSIFLRTMPKVHLKAYCGIQNIYSREYIEEIVAEDKEMRVHVTKTLGIPNCYNWENEPCPVGCVKCSQSCNFRASVYQPSNPDAQCKQLSTKNIAKKMFYVYLSIRKMTGQDPHAMTLENIRDELGENWNTWWWLNPGCQ